MSKEKRQKTINIAEIAKRCGLYAFKCSKCGKEHKGMTAVKELFLVIVKEVASNNRVKINGFGSFSLTSWQSANNQVTKGRLMHRLLFRPSKSAKETIMKILKKEE